MSLRYQYLRLHFVSSQMFLISWAFQFVIGQKLQVVLQTWVTLPILKTTPCKKGRRIYIPHKTTTIIRK